MFVQKTIATTLFAGMAFGLLMFTAQSVNGQIQAGCGCMQPACTSCNACDCGQPSCQSCQAVEVQACGCGVQSCRGGCRIGRRAKPCNRCPNCSAEVCISESSLAKEKRSCWKTEQKIICIPKFRLPWQKCDGPQCGKTKTITLLKKHNFECEVCKHEWKLVQPELPAEPAVENTSTLPPIVPAVHAVKPFEALPPVSATSSLQFESNIIPANTPLIIQGNKSGR